MAKRRQILHLQIVIIQNSGITANVVLYQHLNNSKPHKTRLLTRQTVYTYITLYSLILQWFTTSKSHSRCFISKQIVVNPMTITDKGGEFCVLILKLFY